MSLKWVGIFFVPTTILPKPLPKPLVVVSTKAVVAEAAVAIIIINRNLCFFLTAIATFTGSKLFFGDGARLNSFSFTNEVSLVLFCYPEINRLNLIISD